MKKIVLLILLSTIGLVFWNYCASPLFLHKVELVPNPNASFHERLADSAYTLTFDRVVYDPAYYVIPYPNGDVPAGKGVCTDVVIRAYRKMGIDLQKEVHEDMIANFGLYPKNWGLKKPDKNIDHRRVPNLMKFFSRKGAELSITQVASDYKPGDVVCWNLGGGTTHIGLVVNIQNKDKTRFQIVHNIGWGQVLEDCLFEYKIIGHYRYKK
jgi:uncharacterized protein YijF (DUF1287 family)